MSDASGARIRLTVDGNSVDVEAGTTVAAAIVLAMSVMGDARHAHRIDGTRISVTGQPRAALCGMGVCQECRVSVDGRAHVLACQTLCRKGQDVQTGAAASVGSGGQSVGERQAPSTTPATGKHAR